METAVPIEKVEKLLAALRIARKALPQFSARETLKALSLCEQNDGLYSNKDFLVGFFRYHPGATFNGKALGAIVEEFDVDALTALDLRDGPVLHIVAFVAPRCGFELFRSVVDSVNPWAVSAHRWDRQIQRFVLHRNLHWRKP